jgi:hypothetical protein
LNFVEWELEDAVLRVTRLVAATSVNVSDAGKRLFHTSPLAGAVGPAREASPAGWGVTA